MFVCIYSYNVRPTFAIQCGIVINIYVFHNGCNLYFNFFFILDFKNIFILDRVVVLRFPELVQAASQAAGRAIPGRRRRRAVRVRRN